MMNFNEVVELERYFKDEIIKCFEVYKKGFITIDEYNEKHKELYSLISKVKELNRKIFNIL